MINIPVHLEACQTQHQPSRCQPPALHCRPPEEAAGAGVGSSVRFMALLLSEALLLGQSPRILVRETGSQMELLKLCLQELLELKRCPISPSPPGPCQAPLCFPQPWLGRARCCRLVPGGRRGWHSRPRVITRHQAPTQRGVHPLVCHY